MAVKFNLSPTMDFAKSFFDRSAVDKKLGKATSRVLRQAGAFTRMTARRSMRTAGKKGGDGLFGVKQSEPGKPPLAATRTLKDGIYFYADTKRKSVVIGPVDASGHAAEALEYGGQVTAHFPVAVEMRVDKKDGKRKLLPAMVDGKPSPMKKQRIQIRARPYMRPAFQIMLDNKLKDWLNDPGIPGALKNMLKQYR